MWVSTQTHTQDKRTWITNIVNVSHKFQFLFYFLTFWGCSFTYIVPVIENKLIRAWTYWLTGFGYASLVIDQFESRDRSDRRRHSIWLSNMQNRDGWNQMNEWMNWPNRVGWQLFTYTRTFTTIKSYRRGRWNERWSFRDISRRTLK